MNFTVSSPANEEVVAFTRMLVFRRDLELMNKASAAAASAAPSSANSNRLSSGGGGGSTNGGGGSGLGDGIYNNSHIYNSVPSAAALPDQAQAGTVASGCEGSTKGVSDYGMHELLEEPVEEKVGHTTMRSLFDKSLALGKHRKGYEKAKGPASGVGGKNGYLKKVSRKKKIYFETWII